MAGIRTLRLSAPRRFIADLMRVSQSMPLVAFHRTMALQPVIAARSEAAAAGVKIPWSVLISKAYAQVARRRPELRRCFVRSPWARIAEFPKSIAAIAMEREYGGELAVFFVQFPEIESESLLESAVRLQRYQSDPVESSGTNRRVLRMSKYPWPIRPMLWDLAVNWLPSWRQKYLGTFGLSVTAGMGATAVQLLSPQTTTLHYDAIQPDGTMVMRLTFDHRVLDGGPVARAMVDLEATLNGEIVEELRGLIR
ncbi:hypothetical protein [Tuwongella immobilis]|uniref:2-oxoacid dehydrogenase acyltransferase catalytic domain-containing protein n=1 Tax=Tuwongella immobilis TaxID=692036 RepID=A0A6C2YR93_9BACT|nr:hypothetical protein [Tuwongella immobilis]VIP03679.1 Uncharacterized protein OS=Rhizobium leguminosarum bv. viciae WSM1455 GN=Rleg5DRAFT_3609 PE=4 SV=1 [Tuwongella immobilis]VTS04726.1 Uncharacterized protein OS=Rhizobium leguminosarum bv. viciae WSM1455 GN=Rleg5DRAFT_3609 PE=4 SV=1 [Tuwongella immobilis]